MKRIPNGTTVYKCNSDETDGHQDGDEAIVDSSIGPIPWDGDPEVYGYFLRWADAPELRVFCAGFRVTAERQDTTEKEDQSQ